MKSRQPVERVKLWRIPQLGNIELMHASYVTQTFARHTHDGYAVGTVERGALGFNYRGENVVASPGAVNLVVPGEAHTGHAADEDGWQYRMFYLDAEILREATSQMADRQCGLPFFRPGVIQDAQLAADIRRVHRCLELESPSILRKESCLLILLIQLIERHAEDSPELRSTGEEHGAVKRVREYIESCYRDEISIRYLSSVVNLSPFHLIRVFRDRIGMPPHAYLTQVRVQRAKDLITGGWEISAAAVETGFVDQSHLTRHFKRILGITPGKYRNFIQDN